MWFSGDWNWMCTHQSTTIPLASHNKINRWTEQKEGVNVRESRNRRNEWKNRKECGGFDDSWYCCLVAIAVSQEFKSITFL